MWLEREPRFNSSLEVSVMGEDAYGNPFQQTAQVQNISRRGGLLTGIRCLRAPGDIITVKHRGRKAKFRIVWMDIDAGHVGIHCIEDRYIWQTKLPDSASVAADPALSPVEAPPPVRPANSGNSQRVGVSGQGRRGVALPAAAQDPPRVQQPAERVQRKFPRYRCTGGITVRSKGTSDRIWGRVTVIGLGGCYIEAASPLRPATKVELLIGLNGLEARLEGEVRYSHPGEGMGVVFSGLNEAQRTALERMVATISGRRGAAMAAEDSWKGRTP
jgi:hypothetical protein